MTHAQPPAMPGYPPHPLAPPVKQHSRRKILLITAGLVGAPLALLLGVGILVDTTSPVEVKVTSCVADGRTGIAGFTVTNQGDQTRDVAVRIEYRDGDAARLDTDTSYVRDVRPGDTVRAEERTDLDVLPSDVITCEITGVD